MGTGERWLVFGRHAFTGAVDAVLMTDVEGWVAGIASTANFAPQAWKIIKTRETKNISAWMYGLTVAAFVFWIVYGVLIGQWRAKPTRIPAAVGPSKMGQQ